MDNNHIAHNFDKIEELRNFILNKRKDENYVNIDMQTMIMILNNIDSGRQVYQEQNDVIDSYKALITLAREKIDNKNELIKEAIEKLDNPEEVANILKQAIKDN